MLVGRGIWTSQFDFQAMGSALAAAQEIERLGYRSLWIGENIGRDPFTQAALMLDATRELTVATGVANIWARDPLATLAAQLTLAEAHPGRFLLGLGVSHSRLVEGIRGHRYGQPLAAMREYLDAMDRLRSRYRAVQPADAPRVLGALGPRMMRLAAERADGAHTYFVPPDHTAEARTTLGRDKLLVVEQAAVLETDPVAARAIARQHVRRYVPLDNYTGNLRRFGLVDADFSGDGSDRLVDRVVVWGRPVDVAHRIAEHRQAGADHVCIQFLVPDQRELPTGQWRQMAGVDAPEIAM